jgi:hypothetical protein
MRSTTRFIRPAALVAALALLHAGAALALANTFSTIVQRRFPEWDLDRNGVLTPEEIDRLTVDPRWKGDDAAAIATLKISMRSKKDPIASLALKDLETVSSRALAQDDDLNPSDARVAKKPDTLQLRFDRSSRAIRAAKRELFLDPTPDLDKFRQGRIGDCFFVSMVGAMVERDPQSVKRMISQGPDKDYTVVFGNKQSVTISPLTDVEYALVSTTGDEGLWLPVLEKAFGSLRMETRPEDQRAQSVTDAIARGGNIGNSIQILTGHKAERIGLDPERNPEARDRAAFLEKIRPRIAQAAEARRLMGAGTDPDPGVPGISPNHAFAILSYDAKTDTLRMWNPHGNTFRPKGPPGLANGYPTRAGRFEMPLKDFAVTFRGLFIETDQPPDVRTRTTGAKDKPVVRPPANSVTKPTAAPATGPAEKSKG